MTKEKEKVKQETSNAPQMIDIASLLGIDIAESDEVSINDRVAERVRFINEKLEPISKLMNSDKRAEVMMNMLLQGATIDEVASTLLGFNATEGNPKFDKAVEEAKLFCTHHNLEHNTLECFIQYMQESINALSRGDISMDILDRFWRGFIYDEEVKNAFNAGVVAGKNERIEASRAEREGATLTVNSAGRNVDNRVHKPGYIETIMSR